MFRVLLLEDAPADVELIRSTLKNGGIEYESLHVQNREDYIQALSNGQFDVILADYALPSFDGLSALNLANEICPEVPFILVSAVLGEERAIEALKHGATDYVLKQRLERLVPCVQRAIQEQQERWERRQAEAMLQQTGYTLRTILQATPVAIVTLSPTGQVETWNPAAEDIYGWTAPEVIGRLFPAIPEAQQAAFEQSLNQVIHTETLSRTETQHQQKEGSLLEVQVAMAPLHDAYSQPCSIVMVVADITERKQAEAERAHLLKREQEARAQAEAASRVKDEFLAVLSHELRTPLNSILGWVKLLRNRQFDQTTVERALEVLERNAMLQARLIEDLLDVSRIIRGKLSLSIRPVNLATLIRATVESMRLAADAKSIQIELELDEAIAPILGDAGRLQQVFWNLLSNAIKFTPTGGQVTLTLEQTAQDIQVHVTDTGVGIPANFLPHLFEYFRQADGSTTRRQGGLGLGLAITRHLIELHGGMVHAESAGEQQGATFTIQLPKPEQPSRQETPVHATKQLDLANLKVLIVDDEADTCDLLAFMLEQYGAKATAVRSADEALACIQSHPPDLLMSDISMPQVDGYSLIQQVRQLPNDRGGNVPAIALTAFAHEDDRLKALKSGFQIHLTKPIDPDLLASTILHLMHPTDWDESSLDISQSASTSDSDLLSQF